MAQVKKSFNIDPNIKKIPIDTFQQWQFEYWGNPIYEQEGIRLGVAFLETFCKEMQGDLFAEIARVGSRDATLLICDYLIDYTDQRQIAVDKIQEAFRKGDPEETEGVIVTPRPKPKQH